MNRPITDPFRSHPLSRKHGRSRMFANPLSRRLAPSVALARLHPPAPSAARPRTFPSEAGDAGSAWCGRNEWRRGAEQVVGSGAGCRKTAYRASSPPLNLISPSLDAAPSQYGERGVFNMDTVGQHLGLAAEALQRRVMCPPCSPGGTHQASGAANLLRKITDLLVRRSCSTKCCNR